jgi:hypothetical protein
MGRRHPVGRFELLALVVLGLAIASRDAHAYLDPGTGSYLFQVTAAAGFTALFVLKRWWSQVRNRFRRSGGRAGNGGGHEPGTNNG